MHGSATPAATSTLEYTQSQDDAGPLSLEVASAFGSTACGSAHSAADGTAGTVAGSNQHSSALPVSISQQELAGADLQASNQTGVDIIMHACSQYTLSVSWAMRNLC